MLSETPAIHAVRASATARIARFWDDEPGGDDSYGAAPPAAAPRAPQAVEEEPRPSFEEIEREAFTKGYAQGERAGAEAAARRNETTLHRLTQTIEQLGGLRSELVQKTERQVVELALAIASRILKRELAVDRELLIAMARVALERLGENTAATIRLNPDDVAAMGTRASNLADNSVIRIVADPLVSSGGCLVQSDFGLIDAGIDAQLGEISSALGVGSGADATATLRPGRETA